MSSEYGEEKVIYSSFFFNVDKHISELSVCVGGGSIFIMCWFIFIILHI